MVCIFLIIFFRATLIFFSWTNRCQFVPMVVVQIVSYLLISPLKISPYFK